MPLAPATAKGKLRSILSGQGSSTSGKNEASSKMEEIANAGIAPMLAGCGARVARTKKNLCS